MAGSSRFIDVKITEEKGALPPACPKCGSKQTGSAAKRPTPQSYWRCLKCGEVWNPSLLVGGQGWWQR